MVTLGYRQRIVRNKISDCVFCFSTQVAVSHGQASDIFLPGEAIHGQNSILRILECAEYVDSYILWLSRCLSRLKLLREFNICVQLPITVVIAISAQSIDFSTLTLFDV